LGYYFDLGSISINKYKRILKTADLIPSWMVLKENIDKNMDIIKKHNIKNIAELKKAIMTKDKVLEFSKQSGLPENYVAVLRRVINGYHPKPNRIKDFTCIAKDIVAKLEALGIKNTLHLYSEILTTKKRNKLAGKTGISKSEIMKLTKLTDLSRIRWVNHTFSYVLLDAGYDTAQKVANADYNKMYNTIKQLNQERELYKGNIGAHDMKLCVEADKYLDFEIEYE